MTLTRNSYGIDRDYLRANMRSTPKQRLAWLAAATQFVAMPKKRLSRGAQAHGEKPHR